jgi:NADPH2:quinone reductase
MPHAIRVHTPGDSSVLRWDTVETPAPKEGEVLIRHLAVGVNFIDIYYRKGLYPAPSVPFIPGFEGVGVVVRPGPGCEYAKIGDKVAYCMGPMGAYSEFRTIPERYLVKVPGGIAPEQIASHMLRGMTAHFLVKRTYRVNSDTKVLVHAAAGGTGSLIVQWAKYLGATVIGGVGSETKRQTAEQLGCDAVVVTGAGTAWADQVRQLTNGQGVNVVYDGVGQSTWDGSLHALSRFGMMVSFGQSSGPIPPVDLGVLRDKGSLFVTRPTLFDYKQDKDEYYYSAVEFFDMVLARHLRLNVAESFALKHAAQAHDALESRRLQGACVLTVT